MAQKLKEKELAIAMRKKGKTYREILTAVSVAKSTLSLWLRGVGLSKRQKQAITEKKLASARRGGDAKKRARIERSRALFSSAKEDIGYISERELFLVGVVLYWAEGSKEKDYKPGLPLQFSNMDPRMIQVYLAWLFQVCKIEKNMIVCEVTLHETHRHRLGRVERYWKRVTGLGSAHFKKTSFKKGDLSKTKRKNTGENYFGIVRIRVLQSSSLVRRVAGWTDGVYEKVCRE